MLDASKLSRIITQPLFPLSYKQEKDMKFRDTIVTLLIDNSVYGGKTYKIAYLR